MTYPVIMFAIVLSLLGAVPAWSQLVQSAPAAQELPSEPIPIPGSHLLRAETERLVEYLAQHPEAAAPTALLKPAWAFAVGSTHSWKAWRFDTQVHYDVPSTCRAVGTHCYIFVEDAAWGSRVNQAAVDSVARAFDNQTPADPNRGIFEMVTGLFGSPPDIDGDPRVILLILDIKDTFSGSGVYVAGYFSSNNEVFGDPNSNRAEIYYVDANPLNLETSQGIRTAMSTAAHELQHMIHWGKDPGEQIFFNEGCSCFGESYCGYGVVDQGEYVNETNRSLLDWRPSGDQRLLSDYSRAARFFQYLGDQFGSGILAPIVASPLHGISGLDAALAGMDADRDFAHLFPDWLVANILDDRTVDPRYGYLYPNLLKAVGDNYLSPNVQYVQRTVLPLAATYYSFVGGSDLHITFTTGSPNLLIKAVAVGAPSRVMDVTPGVEFHEPGFGSAYSKIHFVIINTSQSMSGTFSFSSWGTGPSSLELSYDPTEPAGRYLDLLFGDTAAVWFDGVPGARLDSIRVAMTPTGSITGGIYRFTGTVRPTPLGVRLAPDFVATRTGSAFWTTVDLRAHNISANADFAVAFEAKEDAPRVQVVYAPYASGTGFHSYTYYKEASSDDWYILTKNEDTAYAYSVRAYVSYGPTDAPGASELLPLSTELEQNYPNPFNPKTVVGSQYSAASWVKLAVYDLLGREVALLVDEWRAAGRYRDEFDASGLASGVYIYRLSAGPFVAARRMLLVR